MSSGPFCLDMYGASQGVMHDSALDHAAGVAHGKWVRSQQVARLLREEAASLDKAGWGADGAVAKAMREMADRVEAG